MTDLLIYVSFVGNLKCIEDESFVRRTRKIFQPHITLFTKYIALYNN